MFTRFTLIQVTSQNDKFTNFLKIHLLLHSEWRMILFRQCVEAISFSLFLKTYYLLILSN